MTRRPSTRAAFTLIELLVVISIIGVLLALLLPAVQKIRGIGPRTTAVSEIEKLDMQCTEFNRVYKFYPPTVFRIPATYQTTNAAHVDYPGTDVFLRMFPRWMRGSPDGTATGLPGAGTTLTGGQSLVYFLGGPSGTGWAVDAPVAPSVGAAAKNTFYDFPVNRLLPGTSCGYSNSAVVFVDPWGVQAYAYHGSVTGGAYPNIGVPPGVFPFQRAGKFENVNGVQILSAGENKVFGVGGLWTGPNTGAYVTGQAGGDDIANFNGGKMLGVN